MYMGITVSIGEGTELLPGAQSSDYHGNFTAKDLEAQVFYFKPQYVVQINQIRINTMLQDCYQVVKSLGEFLGTGDHSNRTAETYTKNILGELVLKYY